MCLICFKACHENSPKTSKLISHFRVLKSLSCSFVVVGFLDCLVSWWGLGLVGFFF